MNGWMPWRTKNMGEPFFFFFRLLLVRVCHFLVQFKASLALSTLGLIQGCDSNIPLLRKQESNHASYEKVKGRYDSG